MSALCCLLLSCRNKSSMWKVHQPWWTISSPCLFESEVKTWISVSVIRCDVSFVSSLPHHLITSHISNNHYNWEKRRVGWSWSMNENIMSWLYDIIDSTPPPAVIFGTPQLQKSCFYNTSFIFWLINFTLIQSHTFFPVSETENPGWISLISLVKW